MQNNINIIVFLLPFSFSYRIEVRFSFTGYVFSLSNLASLDVFQITSMEKFCSVKYLVYMANFRFKQDLNCYIYYKLCVFIAQSYSPSSHLACFQHILVLLLHILWRGCYVAWYYYHQFLVWLLKLFVSWPHHTALRTMMKVTTVEWSVWIVASVCLCIFLACKEGLDIVLKYYMNVSYIFFFPE